jgi:PrcB C-terminal
MAFLLALTLVLQPVPVELTTISRSSMSLVESSRHAVVRTPDDWTALWKEHSGARPAPEVDFAKVTVVAVFLGKRPTAGYAVGITGTRQDGQALVVQWMETRPPADRMIAQVITSPVHIASMPKFAGEIRFEKVEK